MIGRIDAFRRRMRRAISRSEWFVRLLRLPRSSAPPNSPGLVMVQIDGLSHTQLSRALEGGEMPFLGRLMRCEHYRQHRIYAGVPATTAAYQGELFYGVQAVVPGFHFLDSASGHVVRMVEPAVAAGVERELRERGAEPLLADGSSYANNYTGGAAEPHFCPASMGWGPSLRRANPLLVSLLFLSNAWSFVRLVVLLLLEVILAVQDMVRGLFAGYDLLKELTFVPTRVAISILLRELVTIGAKIDVARGVPVIHLNFLGYDEQAHRRGPGSLFAHWTLKGIDDAIARIWRAAHRSAYRHYDVWIYSDHGQEAVRPYQALHGRSIEAAVAGVFNDLGMNVKLAAEPVPRGIQTQRVRQLGGHMIQRLFPVSSHAPAAGGGQVTVTGMGPVSFVYYDQVLDNTTRDAIGGALVTAAQVPLVLTAAGTDQARAWTEAGVFTLPQECDVILGADHPFLETTARELVDLCHHPDAGDFLLCGWRAGATACSFVTENGGHGGAGPEETAAFALLPDNVDLPQSGSSPLRAIDLRHAALRFLGRAERTSAVRQKRSGTAGALRVMTYNVHSCIGMDGKLAPERIARLIARYAPDVVALQELDVGRARTEGMDQAHLIARYLEMDFHFHPAMHLEEERYGDAILTHLPMRLIKADILPGLPDKPWLEPRGALWVAVEHEGVEYQLLNTHLGLSSRERRLQAEALLGPDWLGHPDCRAPMVLCGDFNALPSSPVCRLLRKHLLDAQIELDDHRPRRTFFAHFPVIRIDHVFVDPAIEVLDIEVPDSELARVASDHLPLIAELRYTPDNRSTAGRD